tara:strand:- start:204 stop:425 length:222 start_codon:yes stop_codon:yes gene_type:complete
MNDIEKKYNLLLLKFEKKKETHKNLFNIWNSHLKQNYNKLNSLIDQGEKVIDLLETNNDIDENTIQLLLILFG